MKDYEKRFIRLTLSLEKISKALQKCKNDRMATLGLRGAHVMCLCQLRNAPGGLTAAELARRCEVDRAFISRTVAELTDSGCILPTKKNGRTRLSLTEEGDRIVDRIDDMMRRAVTMAVQDVAPEELDIFYRVMDTLEKSISALPEEPICPAEEQEERKESV